MLKTFMVWVLGKGVLFFWVLFGLGFFSCLFWWGFGFFYLGSCLVVLVCFLQ